MNRINLDFDKIRVLPYTKSYGKTMYYYRSYWTQKKDTRVRKINKILNERH
jgi:hypothetical protein